MKLRPKPIRTTLVGGIVFLIPVAVALTISGKGAAAMLDANTDGNITP